MENKSLEEFKELHSFVLQLNESLNNNLGNVDWGVSTGNETSWIYYKSEFIEEKVHASFINFYPENESYMLMLRIDGEKSIGIQYLEVVNEGKGIGTEIMNCILDAAEDNNITASVFACAFKHKLASKKISDYTKEEKTIVDKANDRLISWYRSFGFQSKSRPFLLNYKAA